MISLRGGHTIEVLRITGKDRHGEGVHTPVGTIENVFIQWASAAAAGLRSQSADMFQETASFNTVVFVPRHADVKLQARDRLLFNGDYYQVIGVPAWDEDHPATGYDFGYYMVNVEMVS